MNTYESIFVIRPSLNEDEIRKTGDKIRSIIEKNGGSVIKVDDWGKRKLSYEVGKEKKGAYLVFSLKGDGKIVKELNRLRSVDDNLIRSLIVKVDPSTITTETPSPTAAESPSGQEVKQGEASG